MQWGEWASWQAGFPVNSSIGSGSNDVLTLN